MMNWLRSILQYFRPDRQLRLELEEYQAETLSLAAKLAEASGARIAAEDNARFWQEQYDAAQTRTDEAHAETIEAHKRLEDVLATLRWGHDLHGTFPQTETGTPNNLHPDPVKARNVTGRDLARRQNAEFVSQFRKMTRPTPEDGLAPASNE